MPASFTWLKPFLNITSAKATKDVKSKVGGIAHLGNAILHSHLARTNGVFLFKILRREKKLCSNICVNSALPQVLGI